VRAYACINKSGEWINPPIQIIYHTEKTPVEPTKDSPDAVPAESSNPNRNIQELEGGSSD
jgi:hypothetical protein